VQLVRRGPGTTAAPRAATVAAALSFQARFIPARRSSESEQVLPVALLSGLLALDDQSGLPLFTLPDDPALALIDLAISTEGAEARRPLRLELDPSQFSGTEKLGPLLLRLPSVSELDFQHVELDVSLTVGGADEAPLGSNDTLDVPMLPRPRFVFRLVDELGLPLAQVPLELSVLGLPETTVTDADGFARVDNLAADAAAIRFLDAESLKTELLKRWSKPRVGAYVHAAPGLQVIPLKGLAEVVLVQSVPLQVVSVQPRVVQARLTGAMFDTDKSFVLPSVIPSLRALAAMYAENPGSKLLAVGHTDTSGDAAYNDGLSLERAESMGAFLRDDVDAWIKRYDSKVDARRRWGQVEDLLMVAGLTPGIELAELDAAAIGNFQSNHNNLPAGRQSKTFATLPVNGKLDDATRRQLIGDYMNQDDTSLPDDVELVLHGAGEHFPLADDSGELDSQPKDGQHDVADRRVELFFFEADFGIQPPAPGKSSKKGSHEYPEWRRRARETRIFDVNAHGPLTIGAFAPPNSDLRFRVDPAEDGEALAVLTPDQGVLENDTVSFSFVPELLPTTVRFRVERGGRLDHDTGPIQPVVLRDALFRGDLDGAAFQVVRAPTGATAPPARAALASSAPAGGSAQADPNTLPLFFAFHWANPRHRFLRRMSVVLRALTGSQSGQVLQQAPGSRRGFMKFLVPTDADQVRLELSVPSPLITTPIVSVRQEYKILRQPGRKPSTIPSKSNIQGLDQHPRVESLAYQSGDPTQVVVAAELDLLFLDVTAHVTALGKNDGSFGTFLDIKAPENSTTTYRILEHTGGRPVTWPVIIPAGLTASEAATNVLLFFKNEALDHVESGAIVDGAYKNSDDANYVRALFGYWVNPANVAKYVGEESDTSYSNYPPFGWDRQLRQSGKPVVVLFPIPHSVDFGILDQPSSGTKRVVESALRALFAERQIATGQSFSPNVKRLAIGGWSSGTDTLYRWVPVAKKLDFVDEIYCFDGKGPFPVDFEAWFNVAPGRRRLCLIGSAYTEVPANQIKRRLSHPNVFIQPGDPTFWYTNPGYLASLKPNNAPAPLRFRANPQQPSLPSDASTLINLFVESETLTPKGAFVEHRITFSSPGFGRKTVSNVGHEEAAVFACLELQRGKIASVDDFNLVTGWVDTQPSFSEPVRAFRHRHSWSMFGGLFGDKGRPFVGYFQACLERSGF